MRDFDALRLRQCGRMEPSPEMLDPSADLVASAFESTATLWEPLIETNCRHISPLYCDEIALDPRGSMTMDPLHCLSGGDE